MINEIRHSGKCRKSGASQQEVNIETKRTMLALLRAKDESGTASGVHPFLFRTIVALIILLITIAASAIWQQMV